MESKDKIAFYVKQKKLEQDIIDAAEASVKTLKNEMVQELIRGIAIDSQKHQILLKALITLNSDVTPFIQVEDRDKIKQTIEGHIKLEKQAIETYESFMDEIEDEKEQFVVKAIYADERKHHALLKRIYKLIVEKETIDPWDDAWADLIDEVTPKY